MSSTTELLRHIAGVTAIHIALGAVAISCCPAGAQKPVSAARLAGPWPDGHERLSGEFEMMRMCLSGRSTLVRHEGHGKHNSISTRMEYPDERLEYCVLQVKNYRSLMK